MNSINSVIFRLHVLVGRPTQLVNVGDVVRRQDPLQLPSPALRGLPGLDLVHGDDGERDAGVALEEGREVPLRHLRRLPQVLEVVPAGKEQAD